MTLAETCEPDLVLMDIQLPGIDGYEALRLLRQNPQLDGVPVVAVTAFAMREDRERAAREGFDGYLGKPISVRALPSQVGEFLSNGRADVRLTTITILAVDDLPQNLRLLDAVLSPRGYRLLTAASGEEALAMLPTSRRGPRAARHPHAGDRRVRGLPPHPHAPPASSSFRS